MRRPRCAIAGAALAWLATQAFARESLRADELYDAAGHPRYTLYLACRGPHPYDSEQCYTVANAVREWCADRHVFRRTLEVDGAVKDLDALSPTQLDPKEPAQPLRVLLRFEPILMPSHWNEFNGMGRYVPPKAGFRAWIDVFDTRSGQRVAGTTDYTKEATAPHANATPFIQADIARVLAQLEPAAKAP